MIWKRKCQTTVELSKTAWRRLLLLVIIALLLAFGLQHLSEVTAAVSAVLAVFSPIVIGICIAFVVNVPMRPLESLWNRLLLRRTKPGGGKIRQGLRRPVCMILSFLLIAGLLFAVVFLLFPQLGVALNDFAAMLPGYLADLEALWVQLQTLLDDFGFVLPDFALDITQLNQNSIFSAVKNFFTQWGGHILDTTVSITTSVFSGVFNTVLALVFSIYMLLQKEQLCTQIKRVLRAVLADKRVEQFGAFADLVNRTFTNFITGQLTEGVIIGVLCGIGMSVLRMPYAFVVSVIVGFTALIPVFGAYVGTAVGAFLILLAEPVKAIWFVVFIIVLQQLEGNLIYPRVVGKSVGLPGLLVLAAVTVGSGVGGILGMLLAVPVCSVVFTLCTQAVDARLAKKAAAETVIPTETVETAEAPVSIPVPAAKAKEPAPKKTKNRKKKK